MNPQAISALIAGIGLVGNALWTTFNVRMSNRVLKQVDEVKDWVRENYYDQRYIDKRDEEIVARFTRAGA